MKSILEISQMTISILLILSILSQQRSAGLSSTFGGQGGGFHVSKRGAEKVLFNMTVIFAFLFVANSILFIFA